MGLLRWLLGLFGSPAVPGLPVVAPPATIDAAPPTLRDRWRRPKLTPTRPRPHQNLRPIVRDAPPYRFAMPTVAFGWRKQKVAYLDLANDTDRDRLARWDLPLFATPQELSDWLGMPVGTVAWLLGRFDPGGRPRSVRRSHYVCTWKPKRKGGVRLIESPKPRLRAVQTKILREILDRVPPHDAAHGFTRGRSIRTNALPHCGAGIVLKMDLENFYPGVRFGRVTAIFRGLGYSREASLWLASLTTSNIPADLPLPTTGAHALTPYLGRHLPQGAATSPALANLSAFGLDVRLSGLAAAYGGTYTRYADDLTISGPADFAPKLRNVIPLAEAVIRDERFRVHKTKRKVLRAGRRLSVTGVVVNEKPNLARDDYDTLKAILHNCIRSGPASQNRANHSDFAAHLRGRIAHAAMLNPSRGAKLLRLYERIEFGK